MEEVKLRWFLFTLLILVTAFILTASSQDDGCPHRPDEATSLGHDCSIAKQCESTQNCNGRRKCVCDGPCGMRCIRTQKQDYCEVLQEPDNSQAEFDPPESRAFNTTVTYTCNEGSILLSGDLTRVCRGDEEWSGREPTCVRPESYCPRKEEVIQSKGRECLNNCTIGGGDCDAGEECVCDDMCGMTCILTSQVNYCEPIQEIEHVTTTYDNEFRHFGTRATSECDEQGFEKQTGDTVRTCGGDGNWSGEDLVCFKPIRCPSDVPEIANANVEDPSTSYRPGDWLSYSCNYGYYRIGLAYIQCGEDGRWTAPEIECKLKSCRAPNIPENGGREGNVFTFGSTIKLTCNTGYRMLGLPYRTCQGDQEWSGYEPECRPVECAKLYPPDNGVMRPEDQYTYLTEVEITCDRGFIHNGISRRQCQANRQWTGTDDEFRCRAINCGDPGTPRNGKRLGDSYGFNEVVYFQCNNGFELEGTQSVRCTNEEQWSQSIPVCRGHCTLPDSPDHGRYGQWKQSGDRIEDRQTVSVSCNNGYTLNSTQPWTCDNGEWSHQIGCVELPCNALLVGPSGTYIYTQDIQDGTAVLKAGTLATLTCHQGYQLASTGIVSQTCVRGNWESQSSVFPRCIPEPCNQLSHPEHGVVQYNTTIIRQMVPHNSMAIYECNSRYQLTESFNTILCHFGEWNNIQTPACNPAPCNTFDLPNGTVTYNVPVNGQNQHPHSATATFTQCDFGYSLGNGDGVNTCQFGRWRSATSWEPSTCKPALCPHETVKSARLTYYLNRAELRTEQPYHNVFRQFNCQDGFTQHPSGDVGAVCLNGAWTFVKPSCIGDPCTPISESTNYDVTYNRQTINGMHSHGTTATVTCVQGRQPSVPGGITKCIAGSWENSISCESANIAEGKRAIQSSTAAGSPANRAVDGNPSGVLADNSCTHTSPIDVEPWWRVDLDSQYTVHRVTLVNTQDTCCKNRLKGAVIRVGRQWSPDFSEHQQCGSDVTSKEAKRGNAISRDCESSTIGRYVSVQLVGKTERLQLCEVQVFGDAATGCVVPSVLNGRVMDRESREFSPNEFVNTKTYIRVQCDNGYLSKTGATWVYCDANGLYNGDIPVCDPRPCLVHYLNHGQITAREIPHGSVVDYSCFNGYEKKTEKDIRCQAGTLVPMGHACVKASCTVPQLPHVVMTGESSNGRVKDTVSVSFSCEEGYRLGKPANNIRCTQGNWPSGVIEAIQCIPVPCSVPTNPAHGTFDRIRGEGYHQDSVIRLTCNEGFIVNGTELATCDNGQWSNLSTCIIGGSATGDPCVIPNVECPRIFAAGQEISANESPSLPHRSTISRFYSQQYTPQSTCNNGHWVPAITSCRSTCPRPAISTAAHPLTVIQTVNGVTKLTDSSPSHFPLGTFIEARCGDIGKGRLNPAESIFRECTSHGWTSAQPVCESVQTKILFRAKSNKRQVTSNGTVVVQQDYGSLVIDCEAGYLTYPVLSGPQDSREQKTYPLKYGYSVHRLDRGLPRPWHSGTYTCKNENYQHSVDIQIRDARCPNPGRPENGERTGNIQEVYHMKSKVTFRCYDGFTLHGHARITCILGKWSADIPECRAPGCPTLSIPSNVIVSGGGQSVGALRLFKCQPGYSTALGETVVTSQCEADGSWSNQPPICEADSNGQDTADSPSLNLCSPNPCSDWENCVGVIDVPMCFCKHPTECGYSNSLICGTDGQNYTSVCHLKASACLFDRSVDVEKPAPCPYEEKGENNDYSLYSSDNADNAANPDYSISYDSKHTSPSTRSPTVGLDGFSNLQQHIQPRITTTPAYNSIQCPECAMVNLDQACQRAATAFIGALSDNVNITTGEYQMSVTHTYWGNLTSPLTVVFSNVDKVNNCLCPRFDQNTTEIIVMSPSERDGQIIRLHDTDYVVPGTSFFKDMITQQNECEAKTEHQSQGQQTNQPL